MGRTCTSRFLPFFLSLLRKAGLLRDSRNIKTVSFPVYFPLVLRLVLVKTDLLAEKSRSWGFVLRGNQRGVAELPAENVGIVNRWFLRGEPMMQQNLDHQKRCPKD